MNATRRPVLKILNHSLSTLSLIMITKSNGRMMKLLVKIDISIILRENIVLSHNASNRIRK